jgi:hypothetical protein
MVHLDNRQLSTDHPQISLPLLRNNASTDTAHDHIGEKLVTIQPLC